MYNNLTNNQISFQQRIVRLFVAFVFAFVWFLPLTTLAANLDGVLYTDAGITAGASGKTIKAAVGVSATVYSTTTTSGGAWSFTAIDFTNVSTTTPITVWLDGDADDATTLVAGYSGSNITGTPLYYNHVVVYGTSSTAEVQMENFNYSSSTDSDILYLNQNSIFEVTSGTNFIIKEGMTVAPQELIISGNLQADSVFDATGNVLTLKGVGKTISGSFTNDSSFGDVVVSGSYTLTALSNVAATNFTVRDTGTLTNNGTITVSGRFYNLGVFDGTEGSLYAEGNGQVPLVYKAGRDASGNAAGTGSMLIYSLVTSGNYLYIGKNSDATACSQTAGSAIGCEIMVFDISSSTNPVYVAGRDTSGSAAGTGGAAVRSLTISGNHLYIGKDNNATACSQTAGSAIGCEIMVFDISSSTNPVYVAGRDASGSAAGTGSVVAHSIVVSGNKLYVAKSSSATACSQTAGSADGCELMVFDISSSTNPIYVAGRDASGSEAGTGSISVRSLTTSGNYLYVGKNNSATACSQTAGSAIGCELMVFDISSSTNPIYAAGRDTSGSAAGTGSSVAVSLTTSGNYLYVGKSNDATACSQTAGSAIGCEIIVFDISSSTNPVYVAGQDTSGSATGTGGMAVYSIITSGNYLYVAKSSSGTACSQTAGSAIGCEIMVFDISSSTNPVYVAGQDASGSAAGTGSGTVYSITTSGNYLYVGRLNNATACSQTAGSAIGCELMVFDEARSFFAGEVSGNLVDTSSLGDVFTMGDVQIVDNASTTDLTIQSGGSLVAPSNLTIERDFTNAGTFTNNDGVLYMVDTNKPQGFTGVDSSGSANGVGSVIVMAELVLGNYLFISTNGNATACSQTAGSAIGCELQVYDISDSLNPVYVAGRDASGSAIGTTTVSTMSLMNVGNYLYLGKAANATACSQTAGSAIGCELQVYDISSSTNPTYVAGRDASGSAAGTGSAAVIKMTVAGDYLYIGKDGSGTACSQTAGSAIGCELMVFDISSSTNPTYVAGRDVSGDAVSTGNLNINDISITNNQLYIAKEGSGTACSQTAGSAIGCEIMAFDISSSTNPTYVAGRDVSGSADGALNLLVYRLRAEDKYLYAGPSGLGTACSQTAGSAVGCELQMYDISSSTNPVYIAGRDVSGSATGTGALTIYSLTTAGDYFYVGKQGSATACSQAVGSAIGCELMVFEGLRSRQFVSGNLTGANALDGLVTHGEVAFVDIASTTNLSIVSGEVHMPQSFTVSGDYSNGALAYFEAGSELQFTGTGAQTISGNLVATSSLPNVNFSGVGLKTISASASTSNFIVQSGATVVDEGTLEVA